jgi:hypothetical protein
VLFDFELFIVCLSVIVLDVCSGNVNTNNRITVECPLNGLAAFHNDCSSSVRFVCYVTMVIEIYTLLLFL